MKHRFYTFHDFTYNSGSPPFTPLVQSQLRKRIERLAHLHPEWKESDYAQYFREIMLNKPESEVETQFAHWHLLAYLDLDRCLLIWRNFHYFPFYAAKSEDFYNLTNEILYQPHKFKQYLGQYNPQHENQASLKTYIISILNNLIKDNINLQSNWHLLCNIDINSLRKLNNFGQKLSKALEKYGLREPQLSQYIFAWRYFVPVYKRNRIYNFKRRSNEKWPEPQNSDFAKAAQYYNTQRFQPNAPLQLSSSQEISSETLKEWMIICIKALRQAKEIIEISRDADIYERQVEQIDDEITLDYPGEESDSLEQVEIILRQEIKKIEANLKNINSSIPPESRRAIMPLCYANRLSIFNQGQLASLLGVDQGTISRFISKYIETHLLNRLKDLLTTKFELRFYLDTFLLNRFANPYQGNILDRLLVELIQELDDQQQHILKLYYGQKITLAEIAVRMNLANNISESYITEIKHKLELLFQKSFNKWQKKYIKYWLKKYNDNTIQTVLLEGFEQLNTLEQEIVKRRYCQKMSEQEIINLYPQHNTNKIIDETKQQMHNYLIQWINNHLAVVLDAKNVQVKAVIDDWLSTSLIYVELSV